MALVPHIWDGYYLQLEEQASNIVSAAELLHSLATHYEHVSATVRQIRSIEHKGDQLTGRILTRMEQATFFHPREQLRDLAKTLDDVLDVVESAAEAFDLYSIEQPSAPATELIELAAQCTRKLASAVSVLRATPWRRARLLALRPLLEEINRIENLSDKVHRGAMGALFRQGDVAQMIKWKQVYDNLEQITDRCDDVGDALQTAILRRA